MVRANVHLFDAIDKAVIREKARRKVDALIGSLIAVVDTPPVFDRLAEYVYLMPAPEGIIYSFTLSANAVSLTVGHRLNTTQVTAIRHLLKSREFAREATIFRLLRAAIDSQTEPLRAFVAAWTALETFTNKYFEDYETRLFEEMTQNQDEAMRVYSLQIRNVVGKKYALVHKFRVISLMLDRRNSVGDTELFEKMKKTRNGIVHDKSESELPTPETVQLIRKYLRLHFADNSATTSVTQPATGRESNHE